MTTLLLFFSSTLLGQDDYSIRDLKQGKFKLDSSYVYTLPFQQKKKVLLIQAYDNKMSYKKRV